MNWERWLAVVCVVTLAALGCDSEAGVDGSGGAGGSAASGGGGSAGRGGSGGIECVAQNECDDGNVCTENTCIQSQCLTTEHDGVEPPNYDDPAPNDCLKPMCVAGVLSEIVDAGAACTMAGDVPGICDAQASCGCSNPDPTAPHYVDPVNGTDDTAHGGGPGACAYQTLTFALTEAQRDIHLFPATYSANNGETLPFTLGDDQHVICDEVSGNRATLLGKGFFPSSSSGVISMSGDHSGVTGCTIVGTGTPTYCINALANGTLIEDSDVSGCLNGTRYGTTIRNNRFHNNSLSGVFLQTPFGNVTITNNSFESNGTDIHCNEATPAATGSGNVGPNNTPPSCDGCSACPFQ